MTQQWSLPAWAVVLPTVVGLVSLLAVLLVVVRVRRAEQRLAITGTEVAALRDALTALTAMAQRSPAPGASPTVPEARSDYVITRIGDEPPAAGEHASPSLPGAADRPVVAAPLFADLVLRESVVQAASFAAGIRRAMAPETRHRVRLEMRREVKRARKQRRADLRAARRDRDARQRAAVDQAAGRAPDPSLGEGSAA